MVTYRKLVLLIGILVALLAAIPTASAATIIGPGVGQKAPNFLLTDLKNKPHSLTQLLKNGHVLLIFWSTRCPVCRKLTPRFKQIATEYKAKGLTVVGINVGNENKEEVDDYVFEHEIKYLILNDDQKKAFIAQQYRLIGTPTLKLLAPDGTILWHGYGIPDLTKWFK